MDKPSKAFVPASQHSYTKEELLECSYGRLFGHGNAQLPLDQMLMIDCITNINQQGGRNHRGYIEAELNIHPDLWFFKCHFYQDPVMPGCLGLDAMWQLVGFYLGWLGHPGRGRALGVGEVRFAGQIKPQAKKITYQIDLKRLITRRLIVGIADGALLVDGKIIYSADNLRVGLFSDTHL